MFVVFTNLDVIMTLVINSYLVVGMVKQCGYIKILRCGVGYVFSSIFSIYFIPLGNTITIEP